MTKNNIILTGVPRAGTTLTCHLLNKLPNTVALHEPIEFRDTLKFKNYQELSDYVELVFARMRQSILQYRTAISKQVGGQIPDNNFGDEKDENSGLRINLVSIGAINIAKELQPNFKLVIKEPSLFTAALPDLIQSFPTYAIIRNPLSVLASWNTLPFHITKGRSLVARLDIELAQGLAQIKNRLDKQVYILSWFYEKYIFLPEQSILRYEGIIGSQGKDLRVIESQIDTLDEQLEDKNINKIYDRELMLILAEKLLNYDGAYWEFYSRESVKLILERMNVT